MMAASYVFAFGKGTCAPVQQMLEAGARVLIGRDNAVTPGPRIIHKFVFLNCSMELTDKNLQSLSLSPTLFWDTDASKIGLDTHAKTIVERVILHGTWPEFKSVLDYYGRERIKDILVKLRYLDNRTLSFCSAYFNTPITEFRCYTLKQSNPTHWNY